MKNANNPSGNAALKVQLKVQLEPRAHKLLRALCAESRRTPAGQIEFMTIMFTTYDLERRLPPLEDGA